MIYILIALERSAFNNISADAFKRVDKTIKEAVLEGGKVMADKSRVARLIRQGERQVFHSA